MKAHVLQIEQDEDYGVLGIVCTESMVKLSWHLNKFYDFQLERYRDVVQINEKQEAHFACSKFRDDNQLREVVLLKNRGTQGQLIPLWRQMDYFLVEKCEYGDYVVLEKDLNRSSFVQYCSEIKLDPLLLEDLAVFEL